MTTQTSAASLEMTNGLLIDKLSFCIIFCQWSENRALIKQSKLRKYHTIWMRAFRPAVSDQVSRLWNTTSACCLMLKDTYPGATDSNWCQADTVVHRWISVVRAMPHAQHLGEKNAFCLKCYKLRERINRDINKKVLCTNRVWLKNTNSPACSWLKITLLFHLSDEIICTKIQIEPFTQYEVSAQLKFETYILWNNFTEVTICIQH